MDASDIIALVLGGTGFIISIVSIVLTPRLSLKSKRLEYRFELFQKILELWEFTNRPLKEHDIKPLMTDINKLIQLYGYNSEIKLFKELVDSYNDYAKDQNETNKKNMTIKFNDFFSTSFNTYRKEIILDRLKS